MNSPMNAMLFGEGECGPSDMLKVRVPPIKTQGIKTKLVPFIKENMSWTRSGVWIEPFLGSGSVLFNVNPDRAVVSDTNKHIIQLYQAVQRSELDSLNVREFLEDAGEKLRVQGEDYYYAVRARFNAHGSPFDFLFLNRSCFNGLMRFNRKGEFNTPFCRKPDRFRRAYITKICNQVEFVANRMRGKDWVFKCSDWQPIIASATSDDFVYADPPYVGRFTDYFNKWGEDEAADLESRLKRLPCRFLYSMWFENKYRKNTELCASFADYEIRTMSHFYHLGSTERLRNAMTEALVVG